MVVSLTWGDLSVKTNLLNFTGNRQFATLCSPSQPDCGPGSRRSSSGV